MKPNDAWTLDIVADQLANGQRIRALTVVDVFTRESLAIEVGQRLSIHSISSARHDSFVETQPATHTIVSLGSEDSPLSSR